MKNFKASIICKLANQDIISNSIKFTSKGKKYNVIYSVDKDKFYLNTNNKVGEFVTIGEIDLNN